MKSIITMLIFLFSIQSAGSSSYVELKDGDQFLSAMSGEVSVEHRAPNCPVGAVCEPDTLVRITYRLGGCVDSKLSTHKVVFNQDRTVDIYVSAFNISNENSLVTLCTAMPMAHDYISLGLGYRESNSINVHFLGVEESAQ